MTHLQFDFGENWRGFAERGLEAERVESARRDFSILLAGVPLRGKSFLDIGFGQGLALLSAIEQGARVVGCDINPKCLEAIESTRRFFPGVSIADTPLIIGSILSEETVTRLRSTVPEGRFDVVHSWGVLHHTGDMGRAIATAASLVAEGGHLIVAIYNRHWSSPVWRAVKRAYCRSPAWLQRFLVRLAVPVIYVAKLLVTRRNPLEKERGMDFMFDVVDWVGGYPYEYATIDELVRTGAALGFELERAVPAAVPTGCNELVFVRRVRDAHPAKPD